jgi:chromosomal replication initiation ATPase DnaA
MTNLNTIKKTVDELYDLNLSDKCRKRNYLEARGFFCKIAREHGHVQLSKIGKFINKNHATVCHSIKITNGYLEFEEDLRFKYNIILKNLNIEKQNLDNLNKNELKSLAKSLINENNLLKLQLQK